MVEKDGSAKGIVFSQFTSFLDISRHICVVSGADVQLHKKGAQECEWRWVSRFNTPPKTENMCVKREGKEGLAFGRRRLSCYCYCSKNGLQQRQDFDECIDYIDEATRSGSGVLVHCFVGRSRR
ncbi:hypothetical protein ACFX2I_008849 [Malus domestica]